MYADWVYGDLKGGIGSGAGGPSGCLPVLLVLGPLGLPRRGSDDSLGKQDDPRVTRVMLTERGGIWVCWRLGCSALIRDKRGSTRAAIGRATHIH